MAFYNLWYVYMIIDLYWLKDGKQAKHKSNGKDMQSSDLTFEEAYDEIRKKQTFYKDEIDEVDIHLHTSKLMGYMPIDSEVALLGAASRALHKMHDKLLSGKYEKYNQYVG